MVLSLFSDYLLREEDIANEKTINWRSYIKKILKDVADRGGGSREEETPVRAEQAPSPKQLRMKATTKEPNVLYSACIPEVWVVHEEFLNRTINWTL